RLQGGGVPSLSIKPLPPRLLGRSARLPLDANPYELTSETLSNIADKDLRLNRIFPKWRNPGGRSWEQGFFESKGSRAGRALHGAASTVRDFGSSMADYAGA
ncbi:MAG TPA: hypothetical protein DCS66_03870, partial [Flavobacteriaceae bacterium]|nr:hypothetical protein [Flavobacteriaceae bacterium]